MTARFVTLVLLASLVLPVCLSAQTAFREITGKVLDPNRDPLPRARVLLLAADGTALARTRTDPQGRFRFEPPAASGYTLRVELVGFQPTIRTVAAGSEVELVMQVAPVREQVVVTANRAEVPAPQLGASVTVASRDESESRLVVPVSDILQPIPGAVLARTGGLGANTSLFVRGGESDYNKVLLDGIVLNEPGGTFFFSNLMAENLERVEVVRGPQSALFGSDAMTSVVQLFTRRSRAETPRPRFSVSFEGGKHSTWRGRAGANGQAGPLDYSLFAARLNTDNREPNSSFRNTSLSANLGLALGETTALRLIVRGELGEVGAPGPTAFLPPDGGSFLRRRDANLGLALRNQTTSFWEQRLQYAFAQSRQVSGDVARDPAAVPTFEGRSSPFSFPDCLSDFLNHSRRHRGSYQSDWRAGRSASRAGQHFFTFAFEWDRELGFLGERRGDPVCFLPRTRTQAQRDNFGYVVQHQAVWGRLFLTNGFRVEDNDSFGTSVVPRTSLAYFLRRGGGRWGATKLKFNFGLGIKEPNLLESFSPGPTVVGNPALAPERTRSFDAGVEQRFWYERGKLEVNWFDNRFRDLIGFEIVRFVPVFQGSFFNVGRTQAKGTEVILELAPLPGLRGVGSYTFLDSQVVESGTVFDPVFEEGNRLLRRPKHSGSLQLFWTWRRLSVTSTAVFVGSRTDSDFSLLGLTSNDGYTKWDLAWHYRSPHRVTYFGVVENLLNQDYMDVLGFPALKLTFRAGARVDF